MTVHRSTSEIPAAPVGGGSRIRQRQRQRLIDACISALHIYGPSRTTVEKVVALADLSPGIVRFYFDSKAAMLLASLDYLSREFGNRVMAPAIALRETPVQALRLLVDLYLDADIASPRKVSVWYSFWGEASSRQEYLDICGAKDEDFAALVRDLMQRLIDSSGARHLDADGIALGLIGVLEVLWQGIAFQSEANIDRPAAVNRALAYLRSIFPGEFAPAQPRVAVAPVPAAGARLPREAYTSGALLALEREQLLRPAWQLIGHEDELRAPGDFLSGDLGGERVLVVRAERDRLHAFRNTCRRAPHALVSERAGQLNSAIRCATHGLTYTFDGQLVEGRTPGDLTPLELATHGHLVLARATGAGAAAEGEVPWASLAHFGPRSVSDIEVAADWKVLVEQWLESPQPHQHLLGPNQIFDVRTEGAVVLQATPLAPGRARLRRFDFTTERRSAQRPARDGWKREIDAWVSSQVALAESTQSGLLTTADEPADPGPTAAALAQFRDAILPLWHALSAK
ncbi:MAG: Rieske 2Fe-2S domain-containing protein [Proteobacteria bacterium]|nr:Rieske 2Fe-2S domain-containing protein [Pseudomonadota bacterium]